MFNAAVFAYFRNWARTSASTNIVLVCIVNIANTKKNGLLHNLAIMINKTMHTQIGN